MKCPNCNFEIAENTKFCPECGTKIPETNTEATSSLEVTEEVSNAPSITEVNELKKTKKKKIKKIIIISVSALLACGIIFLVLYLVNPSCMFGHDMNLINRVEPTCGAEGYEEYSCSNCHQVNTYTLSNNRLEHTWDNIPCGKENTCVKCGEKKIFQHKLEYSYDESCMYCGQDKFTVKLPTLPTTVYEYDYSNNIEQSCTIVQMNVTLSSYSYVDIAFTVKSTYHEKGSNYSASAKFGWKLYDSDGTVVDSGTAYSDGTIKVGEQSKGDFTAFNLTPWKEYKLVILNLS